MPDLEQTLWAACAADRAYLADLGPTEVQPTLELGARMSAAMEWGLTRSDRVLVLGSDAPTLPPRLLLAALRALERADVVLGPTADGGYCLVGVRGARAREQGRTAALLPPWYDVDTPEDLRLLRLHLALDPGAATATATWLRARVTYFDPDQSP